MINKNLVNTVPGSKKFIGANVAFQWIALLANIIFIWTVTSFMEKLFFRNCTSKDFFFVIVVTAAAVIIRALCTREAAKMSYFASKKVKRDMRDRIYSKLLRLGAGYNQKVNTSEVVQVTVEGTQQLETYFGAYLPQFFYSMLAPVTLFAVLAFINLKAAVILLICVPLIPISIALVQTWAKKLLARYWGQYTALGDSFLENLQGLTTLKIYQTDEMKNQEMNEEAEKFRKITMKVLKMQLNSITIMDLVAYGGAAIGIIIAVKELMKGNVSIGGSLMIILISADFFIPMRQLGSFFHIAMNGMAAWGKIEKILDIEEPSSDDKIRLGREMFTDVVLEDVHFSYEPEREILHGVNMKFHEGEFTGIVGESGCGKSTISSLLRGVNRGYTGSIRIGGFELSEIAEEDIMRNITCVTHNSYLFKGTIRENLLMGNPGATDEMMEQVLRRANLFDFVMNSGGLDMRLAEKGSNLSGGQCQRLGMARALLHDSPIYIFDESTSNIDVESENAIMQEIHRLAENRTVIMISHRLANVVQANRIYAIQDGVVAESGSHDELTSRNGVYKNIWDVQQKLENVGREVQA